MSVPGWKTMTIDDRPGTDAERIVSTPATPLRRSASSGTVMSCSTSSADKPSASVWISTYGGVNSGSVSTGASRSCATPTPITPTARATTSSLNRRLARTIEPIITANLRSPLPTAPRLGRHLDGLPRALARFRRGLGDPALAPDLVLALGAFQLLHGLLHGEALDLWHLALLSQERLHGRRGHHDGSSRRDPTDLVRGEFREPERTVRAGRDVGGLAPRGGDREVVGDGAARGAAADRVAEGLGEPECPVGPTGYRGRRGPGPRIFGDGPARRDLSDLADRRLGEPQSSAGPLSYAGGLCAGGRDGVVGGDVAVRGDPADRVAERCGEPQRPVGAGRDVLGSRCGAREEVDRAACRDAPDRRRSRGREPHVVVRAARDRVRSCVRDAHVVLGQIPRGGDPADLVVARLGEPQRSVRAGGDLIDSVDVGRVRRRQRGASGRGWEAAGDGPRR